jgi:hypothetical protein
LKFLQHGPLAGLSALARRERFPAGILRFS